MIYLAAVPQYIRMTVKLPILKKPPLRKTYTDASVSIPPKKKRPPPPIKARIYTRNIWPLLDVLHVNT